MSEKPEQDDRRLLMTIAGLVVVGAAGIALLAGLTLDDGGRPTEMVRVARAQDGGEAGRVHLAVHAPSGSTPPVIPEALDSATEQPGDQRDPEAITLAPGESPVTAGLAAWEARDYRRAAACFRIQTEERATDAWAWYMLGLARWKDGRLDAAADAMRTSAESTGGTAKAWINLARIENDRGRFEAALAAADAALTAAPDDAEAYFVRGRSLYNLGQTEAAVASLENSLAGDAGNAYALNLLGLIRIEDGSFETAADLLRRAAEIEPDVAFVQNNLGMALERWGQREAAIAAYRRAAELDPAHANAARNLARLAPVPTLDSGGAGEALAQARPTALPTVTPIPNESSGDDD